MHKPIDLKLEKWLPLRIRVRILYESYKKLKIKHFYIIDMQPPKKVMNYDLLTEKLEETFGNCEASAARCTPTSD